MPIVRRIIFLVAAIVREKQKLGWSEEGERRITETPMHVANGKKRQKRKNSPKEEPESRLTNWNIRRRLQRIDIPPKNIVPIVSVLQILRSPSRPSSQR